MNVQEALQELSNAGITNSEQMLRRWVRQGKISASLPSKKEGYQIDADSLHTFIKHKVTSITSNNKNHRTKQLEEENERLKQEIKKLKQEVKKQKDKNKDMFDIYSSRLVTAVSAIQNLNGVLDASFEIGNLSFDLAVKIGGELTKEQQQSIENLRNDSEFREHANSIINFAKNGASKESAELFLKKFKENMYLQTLGILASDLEEKYEKLLLANASDEIKVKQLISDFRAEIHSLYINIVKEHKKAVGIADYRKDLGLPENATDKEVLKRLNVLKMKMHPDRGGSDYYYKQITEAFDNFKKSIGK